MPAARDCLYCGIRRSNVEVPRYKMPVDEIVASAVEAKALGFKSLVLQSGESCQYPIAGMYLLKRIKNDLGLAITLSIGEKTLDEYKALKVTGADRFLLRFETSSRALFAKIKPTPGSRNA